MICSIKNYKTVYFHTQWGMIPCYCVNVGKYQMDVNGSTEAVLLNYFVMIWSAAAVRFLPMRSGGSSLKGRGGS